MYFDSEMFALSVYPFNDGDPKPPPTAPSIATAKLCIEAHFVHHPMRFMSHRRISVKKISERSDEWSAVNRFWWQLAQGVAAEGSCILARKNLFTNPPRLYEIDCTPGGCRWD